MSLGADKVLCLKLGYGVVTASSFSEEISLICQCLIQLYHCSSEYRQLSFKNIGATELIPLLIQVWIKVGVDPENEDVLLPVVQLLRIHAKMEKAKSLMINHNQSTWLGRTLLFVSAALEEPSRTSPDFLFEVLGLIKDLTFRSQATDKEILFRLETGILQRILFLCCENVDSNLKLTEWFTAVIWNLVIDKSSCNQLLYLDGKKGLIILRTLLRVLSSNSEGDKRQPTIVTKIRRNATSALGNIMADPRNQSFLFHYNNTETPPAILSTLIRLVEQDQDSIVRRRAMRTVRCIASSTDSKVKELIEKEDVISFLVETIGRNVSQDDDNDRDMQIQACQTVNVLVEDFEHGDWPRLETALLQRIETTPDPKLIAAACRCLLECVMRSPWKRGPSCFTEMFWKRLETSVSVSQETHNCVAKLLLEMANLESQVESQSVTERPSTLTCRAVVNTLTSLVSQSGSNLEISRNNALEVVLILVQNESNKRPLAENENLLSGLVNLCLLQPNLKNKDLAKKVILDLVPEL